MPDVIHQNIDYPEASADPLGHVTDRDRVRHIGAVEQNRYLVSRTKNLAQVLRLYRLGNPVQHDHRAQGGKSPGDSQTDAAGRSGHDSNAAIQRSRSRRAARPAEAMMLSIAAFLSV